MRIYYFLVKIRPQELIQLVTPLLWALMTWFPFIYMFVLVIYYKLPFRSDYSSEIEIINRLPNRRPS